MYSNHTAHLSRGDTRYRTLQEASETDERQYYPPSEQLSSATDRSPDLPTNGKGNGNEHKV